MSPWTFWYTAAYMLSGSRLIEILQWWVAFKLAFAMGMALSFLIAFVSKLKMSSIVIVSGLYCLLLYLDTHFSVFWISDRKQFDWIAVIGSGVLFSLPGIFASIISSLVRVTKEKIIAKPKFSEAETAHNRRQ